MTKAKRRRRARAEKLAQYRRLIVAETCRIVLDGGSRDLRDAIVIRAKKLARLIEEDVAA